MSGEIPRVPGVKTGRPPLILQEKVRDRLLQAIRVGNFLVTACRYAGVSYAAFLDWMQEGRRAKGKEEEGGSLTDREAFFLAFLRDVENAEAVSEVQIVGNLMRQTSNSPQAALGLLAVRFPERWRDRRSIEVSGPAGGPIGISPVLAGIPDDVLEDRIRALEEEVQPKRIEGPKAAVRGRQQRTKKAEGKAGE